VSSCQSAPSLSNSSEQNCPGLKEPGTGGAKGAKAERHKAAKSRDFGYVSRYVSKSRSKQSE
jgi:hypothetical protein